MHNTKFKQKKYQKTSKKLPQKKDKLTIPKKCQNTNKKGEKRLLPLIQDENEAYLLENTLDND